MTNRAEATAAPAEFTLAGVVYRMSPLTDRDYGELDNWIRKQTLRQAADAVEPTDPPAYRRAMMDEAFRIARGLSWASEGHNAVATAAGMARFMWQTIRACHPDVTVETLADGMRVDPEGVTDFLHTFSMLHPAKKKTMAATEESTSNPTSASGIGS